MRIESSKERVLFYKRLYAFPTRNVTVHRSRPHFSRVRVHHIHSSAVDSKSHYPWQCCMSPRNVVSEQQTKPSEIQFKNGSDHAVIASYSELYEEGEVEHINR